MTGSAPPPTHPEPLIDLQRLVAGVRWRRRIWLGLGLLGLIAGVLVTVLLPSRSTAVTRVYVVHEEEQSGDRETLMKTDLAVLGTTQVAAAAMRLLGEDGLPEDFVAEYSGTTLAANVLEITARGRSDSEAIARAQAVADAFIADHVQRSADGADAEARAILERRAEVGKELDRVEADIAAAVAPGAPPAIASQTETLYGQRAALASDTAELDRRAEDAAIGAPRVAAGTQIIDAPHKTSRSLPVAAAISGGIGLALGLGVGLAFAAAATVSRDRPVLRRDIAAHLGASVIAQLPRPIRGPRRLLLRSSRAKAERKRAAVTLVRVVRDGQGGVSVLELGCPDTAAELTLDIADELATERPVLVVDDLPDGRLASLGHSRTTSGIQIVEGADDTSALIQRDLEWRIGVGSVGYGTPWTDLRRLGAETLLVVRAGAAAASWLHTIARQLADARIAIVGVIVVHPDPRDRSDGTLWNGLHTALRGRGLALPVVPTSAEIGVSAEGWNVNGSATSGNGSSTNGSVFADRSTIDVGTSGTASQARGSNGSAAVTAVGVRGAATGSTAGRVDEIPPAAFTANSLPDMEAVGNDRNGSGSAGRNSASPRHIPTQKSTQQPTPRPAPHLSTRPTPQPRPPMAKPSPRPNPSPSPKSPAAARPNPSPSPVKRGGNGSAPRPSSTPRAAASVRTPNTAVPRTSGPDADADGPSTDNHRPIAHAPVDSAEAS